MIKSFLSCKPEIREACRLVDAGIEPLDALRIAVHGVKPVTRYEHLAENYQRDIHTLCGVDCFVNQQWQSYRIGCIAKGIKPMSYAAWVSEEWKGGEA